MTRVRIDLPGDCRGRRRGNCVYLLLTFAIAWSSWTAVHGLGGSMSHPVLQLATAAFVPAIVASGVRRWLTREGFSDSGLVPRIRAGWRHYLLAAALPVGFTVVALAAAAATGAWRPDGRLAAPGPWLFLVGMPAVVVVAAPLFWGEEFGWTSYLRCRIFPDRPLLATLATGAIWGVWHWPLPFLGYFDGIDMGGPASIAVQLVLWVIMAVMMEFILSWSFWSSGTIWTTSILHAGNNLVLSPATGVVLGDWAGLGLNATTIYMCLGMLPLCVWVVASHHIPFLSHREVDPVERVAAP